MAKSTGHIVDLLVALDRYPPLAVRLFYLRTHYRKPLEFSEAALTDAASSLERLWAFRRRLPGPPEDTPDPGYLSRFRDAAGNDFDMAGALAVLFDLVREGNTRIDEGGDAGALISAYDDMVRVLGLEEPSAALGDLEPDLAALADEHGIEGGDPEQMIEALLARRNDARKARDWQSADAIRDALGGLGIVIEDAADGARWHRG